MEEPSSKIFIFSNLRSEIDNLMIRKLFEKNNIKAEIKEGLVIVNENLSIGLVDINAKNPHLVQPDEAFSLFIENSLRLNEIRNASNYYNMYVTIMRRFFKLELEANKNETR